MKFSTTTAVKSTGKFAFSTRVTAAKFSVICGPMFSGKTKSLIGLIDKERKKGKIVFVFKPKLDDRYGKTAVVSHDKDAVEALAVDKPVEILDFYHSADAVAIDEVQFFDETIVQVCKMILKSGKSLIVSGLDLDYLANPFGSMPQLLAFADDIIKLNAVCTFCSGRARHSHRISSESDIVVLGEKDKYVPLCRNCYSYITNK